MSVGLTYKFKVVARNAFGLSADSAELAILAAQMPDKPLTPSTTIGGANVVIDWVAPHDGGSPITGYKIYIR